MPRAWVTPAVCVCVLGRGGSPSLCLCLPLLLPSGSRHWRQKVRFLKRNGGSQIHAETAKQAKLWGHILNFPGSFKGPDAAFMGLGMFGLFPMFLSSPHFLPG